MAKNQEIDFSTTAASNTDVGGISIDEGIPSSNVNDAMRYIAKARADAITRYVAKTQGTYTAAKTDHAQFWDFTGAGASTLNLTAAATLTSGWCLYVRTRVGITLTIDPNGSETIDSATTKIIPAGGYTFAILCDGSNFVFMNLTALPSATGVSTGFLFGLTLSNGTDATNDIDIAAGSARDSTDIDTMVLATGITKRLDAAWAVGTGNGGLDTGSIADTTYHMWLVKRIDTGVVDVLFSASASSPTMPANYTLKRRIGPVIRAGATILAFKQNGDRFRLVTPVQDIVATNPGTSAVTRTLASIPTGLVLLADIVASADNQTSASISVLVTSLDESDREPDATVGDRTLDAITSSIGSSHHANILIKTNTSAQIRSRASASGISDTFVIVTYGWIDTRGRLA